jgi:pyruvate dehydrogenase E2 component (dihydrolipoamide acetyltransferase)
MSTIHPVTIPKWGIEMQEGTVTGWHVAEGDSVRKGEELIDIESDKIVNTMEAPADGVLHRIIAEADSTLKVGQLLGVIAPEGTSATDIDAFIQAFVPADAGFGIDDEGPGESGGASGGAEAPPVESEPATTEPAADESSSSGEIKASPIARRLAKKLGVDLSTVKPTGRGGRISREDVEAAAAAGAEPDQIGQSAPGAEPLSSRELTAARRLVASKQDIPHFYLQRDLDMRAALDAKERAGVPLTTLLLKAVAAALQARPRLNAHLEDEGRVPQAGAAINVAVDTSEGLVAPLLGGVDELEIEDLSKRLKALAERARNKQLSAGDLAPGGITVSNLGMFGITEFTAIINPPQVAILAVGRLRPLDLGAGPVPAMTVTLSCDHRALDGAEGARFLGALQDALDAL